MTREQLQAKLVGLEIPSWTYQLYDGPIDERFVLEKRKDKWGVYYSERGGMSNLKTFPTEEAACDYFFELTLKYLVKK